MPRGKEVPSYRLLFFQAHRLERWEVIEAAGPIEAVEAAARRPSDDLVELWSEGTRLASFRPAGSMAHRDGRGRASG